MHRIKLEGDDQGDTENLSISRYMKKLELFQIDSPHRISLQIVLLVNYCKFGIDNSDISSTFQWHKGKG